MVLQRVSRASVTVGDASVGSIAGGLVILVGIAPTDTDHEIDRAVDKVSNLRIFADEAGLMNRSIVDIGGSVLLVSQFTLLADVGKGRRPSFANAADPETAEPLIDRFATMLRELGILTETGAFGASMAVDLVNEGPVTIIIDVEDGRVS
jgi:D-tyrosyl-tRNA(Tyr) deacylase